MDNWRDPLELNSYGRQLIVKTFLKATYDRFGNGYKQHSKYLPCFAIVRQLSGDCFYYFDLITEDGLVHSCGYLNPIENPLNIK